MTVDDRRIDEIPFFADRRVLWQQVTLYRENCCYICGLCYKANVNCLPQVNSLRYLTCIYVSFIIALKFMPLFLSIISYLIVGSTRCKKISKQTEQNDGYQSFKLDKWEFLGQIPIVQLVRSFILWNQLRKIIHENRKKIFKCLSSPPSAL